MPSKKRKYKFYKEPKCYKKFSLEKLKKEIYSKGKKHGKCQFFDKIIYELFMFIENVKKNGYTRKLPENELLDTWYEDINRLVYIYNTFGILYPRKCEDHPLLNFLVLSSIITTFEHYFDADISEAAKSILIQSRESLSSCSKFEVQSFYNYIEDDIQQIKRSTGKFIKCFK